MGAVYNVYLKLRYKDKKDVFKLARRYMESAAIFNTTPDTLDGIIRTILASHQNGFQKLSRGEYASMFEASYGWESVLNRFFQSIRPALLMGSVIRVQPDNGCWEEEVTG